MLTDTSSTFFVTNFLLFVARRVPLYPSPHEARRFVFDS
jgi:hypothetical protein